MVKFHVTLLLVASLVLLTTAGEPVQKKLTKTAGSAKCSNPFKFDTPAVSRKKADDKIRKVLADKRTEVMETVCYYYMRLCHCNCPLESPLDVVEYTETKGFDYSKKDFTVTPVTDYTLSLTFACSKFSAQIFEHVDGTLVTSLVRGPFADDCDPIKVPYTGPQTVAKLITCGGAPGTRSLG